MTTSTTDVDLFSLELTDDPEIQNEVFLKIFNSGNGAAFDNLYRADAISNLTGGPLTGEARTKGIIDLLAQGPTLKSVVKHSYTADDVTLIVVDFELGLPGEDGELVQIKGTCTDVIRRLEDGKWMMAVDRPVADLTA
ncbi:YybH family protein [Streptomyces sp. NBC_01092]|uniref:YybH family protein n=1 Tax=Streptomyces sp. NBC_01092 TaxID=2903748 RepID=UPI00386D6853|nr:nuclear transport factor 2 family protein [Streptomyces sp. NBC_01092]